MTLTVYRELDQGSDEWLQARCGILTASVMGQLITSSTLKSARNESSRSLVNHLAAERITGVVEPGFSNSDTLRGHLCEPEARNCYREIFNPVDEIGFMTREINGHRVGFSPDGLVSDDGIIEIKSPRAKKHVKTIVEGRIPVEHMAQVQTGMLVSDRQWCDFISFCSKHPIFVTRVEADPKWHQAITSAIDEFEERVAEVIAEYDENSNGFPICPDVDLLLDEIQL